MSKIWRPFTCNHFDHPHLVSRNSNQIFTMNKPNEEAQSPEIDEVTPVVDEPDSEQLESDNVAVEVDEANINDLSELDELDIDELRERIIELESKNANLADQFVRAKAETDNTRRISTKEVEKARKFALESFSKELLQVKDSLDQATQVDLQTDSGEQIINQMQEGLALTTKQLSTIFERFNIEELNPEMGETVAPELHQAMAMQPSEEVESGKIINVIQVGYRLNTRLLRPAMVIVSSGK
ncbi:MAG: molecular chaperone GrpE [Saprospiraceae bacterium]|jgi:molecular chaperone GrpE